MREPTSAGKTGLAERVTRRSKLLTVTRQRTGGVLRFTDNIRNITFGGNTYQAHPGFSLSDFTVDNDGQVSHLEKQMPVRATLPITPEDVIAGEYDDAVVRFEILIDRDDHTKGTLPVFKGVLGDIHSISNFGAATFEVRDLLDLGRGILPETMGAVCRTDLFNTVRCQKSDVGLKKEGLVVSAISGRTITTTIPDSPSGFNVNNRYRDGHVLFTSGRNEGWSIEVRESTGGTTVVLWEDPPFAIEVGDEFTLWPGCSKIKEDATFGCRFYENEVNHQAEERSGLEFTFSTIPEVQPVPVETIAEPEPEPTVQPRFEVHWRAV